jgi:hypothetical protein
MTTTATKTNDRLMTREQADQFAKWLAVEGKAKLGFSLSGGSAKSRPDGDNWVVENAFGEVFKSWSFAKYIMSQAA